MQIVIYGAAGRVGRRLLEQLLAAGHKVIAYDRNIEQWLDKAVVGHELQIVKGYLLDQKEVEKAMRGADIVFFTISGDREPGDITRSGGLKQVLAGMKATGVRRLLVLGDAILLDTDQGTMMGEQEDFPADRQAYASEHIKMFEQLSTSAVDWTLVCPEIVTDEEAARAYVTAINKQPAGYAAEISAGDLARFMVREMTSQEFLQQRVGIATAR
jgi:putative NADH-flavin reductase